MIEIREMSIADYNEAIALWQATEGMGISAADSRDAIARYLLRNPGMSFIARQVEWAGGPGEVVGAVLCGHDGRRGYLHHLAVRLDFRQHGLGRQLVDRCMDSLQKEGIDKCHLFVYKTNELGRAFWERTGWTERKTLVIMSKDL
jgi:N-acetylglutamate synthase